MVFNSIQFVLFFVVVVAVYWRLSHRHRTYLLLAGSYFFYGCWDWRFLSLLLISTIVDYNTGLLIAKSEAQSVRRRWLAVSMIVNLGLLGVFKYFNFFVGSLHEVLLATGVKHSVPVLSIILPVGISFYTFQTMSYTLDIYRGKMQPTRDFLNFALFVSFFPQLVAGPVERAASLLPQMSAEKTFSTRACASGIELMAWGFFKKMFIADNLAVIVDHVYSTPVGEQSGIEILLAMYAFTIQIYCDFSGYSDIARGTARCLGFELRMNFRCPFFATNPQEFWSRNHISLSTWLRDYLYFSLGGNRGGEWFTYRNIMITMLLGGLWHGAAWTFVFWGAYCGAALMIHRLVWGRWGRKDQDSEALPEHPVVYRVLKRAVLAFGFFNVHCIGMIFFRGVSVSQVLDMYVAIATDWNVGVLGGWFAKQMLFYLWFWFLAELVWFTRERATGEMVDMPRFANSVVVRAMAALFMVSSVLMFGSFDAQQFIYFQF